MLQPPRRKARRFFLVSRRTWRAEGGLAALPWSRRAQLGQVPRVPRDGLKGGKLNWAGTPSEGGGRAALL